MTSPNRQAKTALTRHENLIPILQSRTIADTNADKPEGQEQNVGENANDKQPYGTAPIQGLSQKSIAIRTSKRSLSRPRDNHDLEEFKSIRPKRRIRERPQSGVPGSQRKQ